MDTWYLLDTQNQGNIISLKFLNAKTNELKTIKDTTYKPYFYLQHPLSPRDQENVRSFNAETEVAKKTDLYTNQLKEITKITLPNPDLLKKAIRTFTDAWEIEVEYTHSYAYDHGIVFGAQHTITQDNHITPELSLSQEAEIEFNTLYAHLKQTDPMKYAQLERWFAVLNQPVPQVDPKNLGLSKDTPPEKIFSTFTLSRISNLPIPYTYATRGVSAWLKSIMHDYLRRNNILIPTSNELRRGLETHEVPGALTITPKSGVYFNTVVADFESLYPSCIDSYNLSYETVDCQHEECKKNQVSDTGHHVCTKRRGFLAANVGALKDLRIHWLKPQTKDPTLSETQKRQAETTAKMVKLLTVSSYGVSVRIHGLACPPLAESITGYGRWALQTAWNTAEKLGLHPVYGDTDSLFLENAPKTKVNQLLKTVKEEMRLDLAVERQYSVCVLSAAKKAYFGILPDGTPDLKGLTAIKSNAPKYIQDVFKTSVKELATVNNSKEYEQAKEKIITIVENSIKDLRNRKFKTEDMIFSIRIDYDPREKLASKFLPQPYQCAKQLLDSGINVNQGDTVRFIKVRPFPYQGKEFTVKPADQVKNTAEINVEDYVRNLTTALNQVFKPMGIEIESEPKPQKTHAREQKITDWLGKKS